MPIHHKPLVVLLLCSFFLSQEVVGQENPYEFTHELGFGATGLLKAREESSAATMVPGDFGAGLIDFETYQNLDVLRPRLLFGFNYRYHIGTYALRFSLSGINKSDEIRISDPRPSPNDIDEQWVDQSNWSYKNQGWGIRVGYQKDILVEKRADVYYGVDALLSSTDESFEVTNQILTPAGPLEPPTKVDSKQNVFNWGVSPLLGVRFKFGKRISVTTESRFQWINSDFESDVKFFEDVNATDPSDESKSKSSGNFFELQPLGIVSLNLHF